MFITHGGARLYVVGSVNLVERYDQELLMPPQQERKTADQRWDACQGLETLETASRD